MSRSYNTEAVILARRNYSEADRILTLYSKHLGRITTIAKGVRRPTSRKRGSLEIFSHIKFSAARGKNLDIITEVETIENFDHLRKDLKKVSVAYFFVEVVTRSTGEAEESLRLYEMLLDHIHQLSDRNDLGTLRKEFINKLLIELGYWPEHQRLKDHDGVLESVLEKPVSSRRVGKIVLN